MKKTIRDIENKNTLYRELYMLEVLTEILINLKKIEKKLGK